MDLHQRRSVLVRMTADGRRLGTARITNGPAELRKEIAKAERPRMMMRRCTTVFCEPLLVCVMPFYVRCE